MKPNDRHIRQRSRGQRQTRLTLDLPPPTNDAATATAENRGLRVGIADDRKEDAPRLRAMTTGKDQDEVCRRVPQLILDRRDGDADRDIGLSLGREDG